MIGLLGSIGSGLASGILGKIFGGNSKKEPSPYQHGLNQKDYFKGLYGDKLNPWEWAGSGGFGVGGTAAPSIAALGAQNLERQKVPKEAAIAGAQMQTQKEIAQIQAKATTDSARINRGMHTDEPDNYHGDKLMEAQVNNLNKKTEHVKTQIKRDKTINDILRTAKSLSEELNTMFQTLKGDKKTILEALQSNGFSDWLWKNNTNIGIKFDNMLKTMEKNAKGNVNLFRENVVDMMNKLRESLLSIGKKIPRAYKPNMELNLREDSTSSPSLK